MFLLITGISGCEKQNTGSSLAGTVWVFGSPGDYLMFVSAEDCFFATYNSEYVHYKYFERNSVVYMTLYDTKNTLGGIKVSQSYTGTISSPDGLPRMSVIDSEKGTNAEFFPLLEWEHFIDIRSLFEELQSQI